MDTANPFSKSVTIDPEVRAYIYSLVNALGGRGEDELGNKYSLGDDALAVLRDLKRWLKLYDEKTNRLDVARCLAEASLVRGDLLPILSLWKEGQKPSKSRERIALACLELLVPLTWPLGEQSRDEYTVNHARHTPYLMQAQVKYKAAVLHWEGIPVLRQAIRCAIPSLAIQRQDRSTRDDGIIKLLLYFLRNIAAIHQRPNLPSQGLDMETSKSSTIEVFRRQDVFGLLLTMCSNLPQDFNQVDVIVLEVIFHLVKGVHPQSLYQNAAEKQAGNVAELQRVLAFEKQIHAEAKKKEWSRHGRFGTMIWVKTGEEDNNKQKQSKYSAVSGQDNLRGRKEAMFSIDNVKKWNKPITRGRPSTTLIIDDKFEQYEILSNTATDVLRNFAEEFLDSGFNPLITHLRKAIEREAERLQPQNYRQFFYVVSWFLRTERARRDHQKKKTDKRGTENVMEPESFGIVAAVLNQETFILLNRYMQLSLDDKNWLDLNACMRCFTEVLLTTQEMSQSPLEEDREIAENIQSRIFYEESTHDRIQSLLKGYKDQGLAYLDSVTELSHVFIRMLEHFSKENLNLQVRSKRKAVRKTKEKEKEKDGTATDHEGGLPEANVDGNIEVTQSNIDADDDEASEREEINEAAQVSRERKFDFKRFSAKFISQASVDTYISLLKAYPDLSAEQLKRAHRFLHRVAFKQDTSVLLFRVDIVVLLYRMIEGPDGLNKKLPIYTEYQEFVTQLFKKLFKKLGERPELFTELLFSKLPGTLHYLEYGFDRTHVVGAYRAPAELEVKRAYEIDRKEQIGVVVTLLLKDEKIELVDWVKTQIGKAFEIRSSEEARQRAEKNLFVTEDVEQVRSAQNTDQVDTDTGHESIALLASPELVRVALNRNARFRLLCKLSGMLCIAREELDAPWLIPAAVNAASLLETKEAIEHYIANSWRSENAEEEPEDMLRRAHKDKPAKERTTADGTILSDDEDIPQEPHRDNFIASDSEADAAAAPLGEEEFLFPDNPKQPRDTTRRNLLDELREKRRKRKRARENETDGDVLDSEDERRKERKRRKREEAALAKRRKYKSEAYVLDESTDEEADREFFAKEREARARMEKSVREMLSGENNKDAGLDDAELERRRKMMERLRGDDVDEDSDSDVGSNPPDHIPFDILQNENSDTVMGSGSDQDLAARTTARKKARRAKKVKTHTSSTDTSKTSRSSNIESSDIDDQAELSGTPASSPPVEEESGRDDNMEVLKEMPQPVRKSGSSMAAMLLEPKKKSISTKKGSTGETNRGKENGDDAAQQTRSVGDMMEGVARGIPTTSTARRRGGFVVSDDED